MINTNDILILELTEKIKTLEDTISGNKKKHITRAQQMLLLKHSGLLEIVNILFSKKKDKAKFLSILLDASADNIEDDLTNIDSPNSKLRTSSNYEFLEKTFNEFDLKAISTDVETIHCEIIKKG